MGLKPTLLIAFDKNDSNKYILSKKIDRKKISIIYKEAELVNLTKGHKIIKTDLAYINPEYNDIISSLISNGYRLNL